MAKWSGKVYFVTSSQGNRNMAQGRYPHLPFDSWKPRPERQRITAATRLDGVLIMLDYGLRMMSDVRLTYLVSVLQDELDRNERRWVQLNVEALQNAVAQIKQEQVRRQTLLNPSDQFKAWFTPLLSNAFWTPDDAKNLRSQWEVLITDEEHS